MTAARLRHSLSPDAEDVWLCIGGTCAKVKPWEAKRFAWGVLNDLCPDDVEVLAHTTPSTEDATIPDGFHKWAVLLAIRDGVTTSKAIARKLGMERPTVSVILSNHKNAGRVEVASAGIGTQGVWSLTKAGREHATEAEAKLRAALAEELA